MRIAIVNDLPIALEGMRRSILRGTKHEIAWIATTGTEAVARCKADRPDLILMDLVMPEIDGVAATRQIMAQTPCAIVVVTATIEGNSTMAFEAMGAGALDVVQTPSLQGSKEEVAAFLKKIEATASLIGDTPALSLTGCNAEHLLAIGASAGGPAAVQCVLAALPPEFPAAVVVVQHVDAHFAPGLADWLGQTSRLPVRVAAQGDTLQRGAVYLAGTNDHLVLKFGGRLAYTPEPASYSYRPSVDAFFHSAAKHWGGGLVGVLLTGMGRDGAGGLKELRAAGHHTIAQDRETSAVYGMPKAAAEANAAVEILPLDQIAPAIARRIIRTPIIKRSTS